MTISAKPPFHNFHPVFTKGRNHKFFKKSLRGKKKKWLEKGEEPTPNFSEENQRRQNSAFPRQQQHLALKKINKFLSVMGQTERQGGRKERLWSSLFPGRAGSCSRRGPGLCWLPADGVDTPELEKPFVTKRLSQKLTLIKA